MIKLLVSDYDNTFYKNKDDILKNIEKVVEYRNCGNLFVIATGRSYQDFVNITAEYNIPIDYIVLNHGATIIKENKIIKNEIIDNDTKNKILDLLEIKETKSYFVCREKERMLDLNENNLTKINVTYKTKEQAEKVKRKLLELYSNEIKIYEVTGGRALEIVSINAGKCNSIAFISNLENIILEGIYVIGDNYNDIEMIKRYAGYCMTDAIEEVRRISKKEYQSVYNLIEELIEEK